MGYIIQTDEVALSAQEGYRARAIALGKKRALALKVATSLDALKERAFDYVNDFVVATAGAAAAAGLSGWFTMPLAVAGNPYSVFATNVPAAIIPQVPDTQVWVFYKYCIPYAINFPVSYLIFTKGRNAESRMDEFDLEPTYAKMSTDGFFSDPVVYNPAEFCGATVRARIVAPAFAFVLQGWVIEPRS